jgi:hypothetical protein
MKAQTLGDQSSLEFMRGRRILEINPDHPIIKDMNVRQFFSTLINLVKLCFCCCCCCSSSSLITEEVMENLRETAGRTVGHYNRELDRNSLKNCWALCDIPN